MLIEVTGGSTWTGLAVLRVGAVRMLSGPTLLVEATLDYPPPGSGHTRDLGRPFAVLATPVFDGTVMVDISVMHGIQRGVEPEGHERRPGHPSPDRLACLHSPALRQVPPPPLPALRADLARLRFHPADRDNSAVPGLGTAELSRDGAQPRGSRVACLVERARVAHSSLPVNLAFPRLPSGASRRSREGAGAGAGGTAVRGHLPPLPRRAVPAGPGRLLVVVLVPLPPPVPRCRRLRSPTRRPGARACQPTGCSSARPSGQACRACCGRTG